MPTKIYNIGSGGSSAGVSFPIVPPALGADLAPTTLAEFHGQNAYSQAVVNTTGGNVSVEDRKSVV